MLYVRKTSTHSRGASALYANVWNDFNSELKNYYIPKQRTVSQNKLTAIESKCIYYMYLHMCGQIMDENNTASNSFSTGNGYTEIRKNATPKYNNWN